MKLKHPHHIAIWEVLSKFDNEYLTDHSILFGGGTRIALELSEYRVSVDIDFLCADSDAYKAVRSQITSRSFGELLRPGERLNLLRDIRADRDGVRTFVESSNGPVKLEFIHFDSYDLKKDDRESLFSVPFIDRSSCLLTKLLANADRYQNPDKKDIVDLCLMHHHWGSIPKSVWAIADKIYGMKIVLEGLEAALAEIENDKTGFKKMISETLSINPELGSAIVNEYASAFSQDLLKN